MTKPENLQRLVFAVHPYSRGFGWVAFEGPLSPIDWGIVEAKKDRNARCLARIGEILERYEPPVLVLEQFDLRPSRRGVRVKALCRAILHLAANRGAETVVYSRAVIRSSFTSVGAGTRHEIAQVIGLHIHALRRYLPRERKAWQSEDSRQCLFDAAALAMTHFAVTGSPASLSSYG